MQIILKKNLLFLKKNFPKLFNLIHLAGVEFLTSGKSTDGKIRIPLIDGQYTHACLDPLREALEFVEKNKQVILEQNLIILGCGLGYHLLEIFKVRKENQIQGNIFVIEKNKSLFKTAIGLVDITEILDQVNFFLDEDPDDISTIVGADINKTGIVDFFSVTRFDTKYYTSLREKFVVNSYTNLQLNFEKNLRENFGDFQKLTKKIRSSGKITREDFSVLVLEEIYNKNRKNHASFNN